jgi:hypothetical protein
MVASIVSDIFGCLKLCPMFRSPFFGLSEDRLQLAYVFLVGVVLYVIYDIIDEAEACSIFVI